MRLTSGDWLCQYGGCLHVLWTRRSLFLEGFLYIILDDPSDHNPLVLLQPSTEIFYFNPADAVAMTRQGRREWKVCDKNCSSSRYLEDMKASHDIVDDCEEKVLKRVRFWNKCVGNIKVENRLEKRLDKKISGMWLCNIL